MSAAWWSVSCGFIFRKREREVLMCEKDINAINQQSLLQSLLLRPQLLLNSAESFLT